MYKTVELQDDFVTNNRIKNKAIRTGLLLIFHNEIATVVAQI